MRRGLVGIGGQAGLLREIEAEDQVGAGGDGQIHRVAGGLFSGRDGEFLGAVEGEGGLPVRGADGRGGDGQGVRP